MSQKIRLVVDSAADFPSATTVERYRITLVPQIIQFGGEKFKDGLEMDAEGFFRHLSHDVPSPSIHAPSVEDFIQAYSQLHQSTDQIISLHPSRYLSASFERAKQAAQALMGRCDIMVLDSQTTSVGLGLLAEMAARTAETTTSLDDAVRILRGAVHRIYSIFHVETMDYIQRHGLLGEAQAILGAMLGIKPFLTIEDGKLLTMEKVRSRSQAVDRLVEFVLEFEKIERMVILQSSPFNSELVRLLQERLNTEYGRRNFTSTLYGPALASVLGTDATGIVVLEYDY